MKNLWKKIYVNVFSEAKSKRPIPCPTTSDP